MTPARPRQQGTCPMCGITHDDWRELGASERQQYAAMVGMVPQGAVVACGVCGFRIPLARLYVQEHAEVSENTQEPVQLSLF